MRINGRLSRNIKDALYAPKNLLLRAIKGESLKPKWLVLMITDRCNSRCVHCNIWRRKPIQNPLTPEEIEKTLCDKLFEDVEYVLCTGGEPTVRSDLKDIILGIHKALPKATLQLSTNAILPDRAMDVVETALANNIVLEVGVSLDGIGENHDKVRGIKGNFERGDWLLHELVKLREKYKNRLKVSAGIVLSDLTLSSLGDVRRYCNRLNIILVETWYNESSFYDNTGKRIPISSKLVEAVKTQPPSPLQERWLKALEGKSIRFPCFAMYKFFVLKCNGDVAPCLSLWDAKAGNVRESSPSSIWKSPEAEKVRKVVRNCRGCLNSWGAGWSFKSSYYPILLFYLGHPLLAVKKLMGSRDI